MSFRLPQNLKTMLGPEDGLGEFNREVLAEKASSLGRAGRALERSLVALAACEDPDERPALVKAAARAAHHYFIQQELCGLRDHSFAIEHYAIPREVMAQIGAS